MKCKKCGSNNISVQMVSETKMKKKGKGILYWLFFGWLFDILMWLFLTIPMLLGKMFGRKDSKLSTKHKKIAVCQNCGHSWKV